MLMELPNLITVDPETLARAIEEHTKPLRDEIEALKKEIRIIKKERAEQDERIFKFISEDRKRLSKLEGTPQPSGMTDAKINKLYEFLVSSGQRGVTYRQAAQVLGVSKPRICQLRGCIEDDERFLVSKHPTRKNTYVICLRKINRE